MRGKARTRQAVYKDVGITPAYAGKRKLHLDDAEDGEDHPCVCGEKSVINWHIYRQLGSPLRMRGKVYKSYLYFFTVRITPAYAGKSAHISSGWACLEDHPCVCGEKDADL